MKKIFFIVLSLGIIISGCAKKDTVRPGDPAGKDSKISDQKKTDNKQAERSKALPDETVKSSDTAEKARAEELKELQAMIKDIHFDFDKYTVEDGNRSVLKANADILLRNKDIKVLIEGHCDDRGTNEYNLALGDRRANSVREYLLSLGIQAGRMDTISYGEEKPFCKEDSDECWAKNRRAHFTLNAGKR